METVKRTTKRRSVKKLVSVVKNRYDTFTSYLMKRILRYRPLEDAPRQYFCYLEKVEEVQTHSTTLHVHQRPLCELDEEELKRFVRHVLHDEDECTISLVIAKIKSQKKRKRGRRKRSEEIFVDGLPEYEKVKMLKQYLMEVGKRNKKRMLKKIFDDEKILDMLGIDLKIGDRYSRPYLIAEKIQEIFSVKVSCKTVYQLLRNKIEMERPLFKDYETYCLIKTFVENNPDKYNGKNGRCVLAADLKTKLGIRLSKDTLKIKLTQMMRRGELPYKGWADYSPRYVVRNNRMKFLKRF